jgi:hypothetical protein
MKAILWSILMAVGGGLVANSARGATTNLFFTQFEAAQGYSVSTPLVGQPSSGVVKWTGQGTGGNGVTNNFVAGQGQQALVGRNAILPAEDILVWYPLNFSPVAAGYAIVRFSVFMSVEDSTNNQYDNFRWSVYNTASERLFSLDFDNYDSTINYDLDDTNTLVTTGWSFATGTDYELVITMNFASNHWSATLGGAMIVTNLPITTTGAALTLGDIDAVWLPYYPDTPGNNFMLFDDYRVTAESVPTLPAQMRLLGRTSEGWSLVRVSGQEGSRWALEGTTNLLNWTALKTNLISGGYFDHVDATAAGLNRRFYRARLVP